jgi:hypothetical protein
VFGTDGYIKVFVDLPRHPKSLALSAALKKPRAWTFMVELWLWASEIRADGDLSDCTDAAIARAAGFQGSPKAFVDALKATGFLTEEKTLAKWTVRQAAVVTGVDEGSDANSASERDERPLSKSALRMRRKRLRDAGASQAASHVTPDVTGCDAPPHTPPQKDNEKKSESDARASHVTSPGMQQVTRHVTRSWTSRGVVGLVEEEARPRTPAEWIAAHGAELAERYAALKGPLLLDAVTNRWKAYEEHAKARGLTSADAGMRSWLAGPAAEAARLERATAPRGAPTQADAEAIWANSAAARFGRPLEPEDD